MPAHYFMFMRSMIQSRQPFPEAGGRTKGAHSTAEFDGFVKDGLTLVDFYATWCPPCRACTPAFGAMSMKWAGAEFVKCDVDECREVAQREGVTAMPTFKIYKMPNAPGRARGSDRVTSRRSSSNWARRERRRRLTASPTD